MARKMDEYLKPAEPFEVEQLQPGGGYAKVLVPGMDSRMSYDLAVADIARKYIAAAIVEAAEDVGMPEIGDDFPDNLIREDLDDDGHLDLVYIFTDDVVAAMRQFAWTISPQNAGRPEGW